MLKFTYKVLGDIFSLPLAIYQEGATLFGSYGNVTFNILRNCQIFRTEQPRHHYLLGPDAENA